MHERLEPSFDTTLFPYEYTNKPDDSTPDIQLSAEQRAEFGKFLAAFNCSPKAFTYVLIPVDRIITPRELSDRFSELVAGTKLESFQAGVPARYCETTLIPLGLVQEHRDSDTTEVVGFSKAREKSLQGITAASLVLYFEQNHHLSVRKLLGKTATPTGDSSPLHRADILLFLATKKEARHTDITQATGISHSVVSDTLRTLKNAGLVEYDAASSSSRPGESVVFYTLDETRLEEMSASKRKRPMLDVMTGIIRDLHRKNMPISQAAILKALSEEVTVHWKSHHALFNYILKNLSKWEKKGYIQRIQFKGGEKYSEARITELGSDLTQELLLPLAQVARNDSAFITQMNNSIVQTVLGNFDAYCTNSAKLYYPHSNSFRSTQTQRNLNKVYALLQGNEQGMNATDISESTGLNVHTVRGYIRSLTHNPDLSVTHRLQGIGKYYTIVLSAAPETKIPFILILPEDKQVDDGLPEPSDTELEETQQELDTHTDKESNYLNETEYEAALSDAIEQSDLVEIYKLQAARSPLLTASEEKTLAKRMEDGKNAQQLVDINSQLAKTEQQELTLRIQYGAQARASMIQANTRLVMYCAKKYCGQGVPFIDLISEGNIGLLHAVDTFDYKRGYRFSTYGIWWIRESITRAVANQSRTIRLPVDVGYRVNLLRRLQQELGVDPSNDQLATALETTIEDVENLKRISQKPLRLEQQLNEDKEDGSTAIDLLADERQNTVGDANIGLLRQELIRIMSSLPEREQYILKLRSGMEDGRAYTQEEIARKLGLSRERIRQLEAKAMKQIRSSEEGNALRAFLETDEE